MQDEHDEFDDGTGSGQQQEPEGHPHGIEEKDGSGVVPSSDGELADAGSRGEEELEKRAVAALRQLSVTEQWAGMLPHPKSFNAYNAEAQRMILDCADRQTRAVFDDESKRQDKLVEAEIRQGLVGQVLSACVILASIAASVAVGIKTGNAVMSGAFLVLPFTTIIGQLFRPVLSGRGKQEKREKQDDDAEQ